MQVHGNHPLAEVIARKLSGIVGVPPIEAHRMVNAAAIAAIEWYEAQKIAETTGVVKCPHCGLSIALGDQKEDGLAQD